MDNFDEFDDMDEIIEDDEEIIIIEDEFGNEQNFYIIDSIEHKGSIYLLVAPSDEEDENFEATILKQTGLEEDNAIYELIDDDNEFNEVAALFMENDGDYELEL